jgi:predicted NACHT family NTPase
MPKKIIQLKVFVSCPSDVENLKSIVNVVCDGINQNFRDKYNITLFVTDWRKSVVPQFGPRPQELITEQIGEYDIFIVILGERFGTPPGAINPDTGEEYESGTEEELFIAYDRWKEKGEPLINIYFKMSNSVRTSSESEQFAKVLQFKEKLRSKYRRWTVDFTDEIDFERKVRDFLQKAVLDFDEKLGKKKDKIIQPSSAIQRQLYPEIKNYLSRKTYPAKDANSIEHLFYRDELLQDFLNVIKQHNRIVLISDAGVGKTTELRRIAWYFSNDDSPFYPIFMPLNKYVNQNLSEFLPPDWIKIPESQVLIILDGLDEIESKNKNDAIRQIEIFSEQHPSLHIVVSCRTNFYKSETEQSSGTLRGFSFYALLELDSKGIEKYIDISLGERASDFNEAISRNTLQDLLRIPFYLIHLVELFKINRTLPQSKAEIFEQLLIARMKFDVEHFRTTIELDKKPKTIVETLERLGLGMESLGRNYVTDDEFQKLIPDESLRVLLEHCAVWKKNEGDKITWQFEHNNFQEYLAARVLSRKSLDIIKDFISLKPDHRRIIPSWVNTFSFLVSISDDHDLFNWILDNEPELAVKFEPDKIDIAVRIRIFKEIFNNYKVKQIRIDREKFRYSELAQFGQSDVIVDFLLDEAEAAIHYTTRSNAIELLGKLQIPHSLRQRTSQLLVRCVLDKDRREQAKNRALIALADLKLNSQEVINQIVPALRSSDSDWVRFGLYYFLYNSDYLNDNIAVFLEGIKYVQFYPSMESSEVRLGDEHWHLTIGLEKAKSPTAIREIFIYFKEHPTDLADAYFEKSFSIIVESAASAYSKEPSLFELAIDLFEVLVIEHLEEEARQFICFFNKTNTRLQAFQKVFAQKGTNKDYLFVLATLADSKCIDFFVQQYEEHNITNDDIGTFQDYLGWENHDLYLPFNKLINEKSGNKFIIPPKRDFNKERKQRRKNDFNLLFKKQAFLKELELIFETEQKEFFTSKELLDVETRHRDNPYFSDLAIHTLREIASNQTVSLKNATQIPDKNWNWFCISKTYEYLTHNEEINLLQEQKDWVANWCYSELSKVDFKTALVTKPNGQFSTNWLTVYLWYFLRKLNLDYPKDVLLNMLSFDLVEGHQMLGIKYLEERLNEADITERILENLQEGIKNNDVLRNHIDYCKGRSIKGVLPYALHEISNPDRSDVVRRVALETVCELSETLSDLEQILSQIKDDFKWDVVEQLIKRNSTYPQEFLLEILVNGNEQEKLKSAEYLIELQNLGGLKYYVEWIKRQKQFPERSFDKSSLSSLQIFESMPFLIELLKISYQDDFVQDDFHRLDSVVLDTLSAIALQSDEHYIEIKKAIEKFIKEYSSSIKNINFLHTFLEKLEHRYYVIRSEKLDISDVTKKLKAIYPDYY